MKYKLLKDLPTFKAGEIFEVDSNGHLRQSGKDGVITYRQSTLAKFPNILKDWFEKIEEPTRWRAEHSRKYYFIDSSGVVQHDGEYGCTTDLHRYTAGNYFQTEKEANRIAEWIKAYRTLLDDTKGHKWKKNVAFNMENFFAVYSHSREELIVDNWHCQHSPIVFRTREDAEWSIKNHRKEWLTFFRIKEEA